MRPVHGVRADKPGDLITNSLASHAPRWNTQEAFSERSQVPVKHCSVWKKKTVILKHIPRWLLVLGRALGYHIKNGFTSEGLKWRKAPRQSRHWLTVHRHLAGYFQMPTQSTSSTCVSGAQHSPWPPRFRASAPRAVIAQALPNLLGTQWGQGANRPHCTGNSPLLSVSRSYCLLSKHIQTHLVSPLCCPSARQLCLSPPDVSKNSISIL